jgi:hypothetical protein
MRTTFIVGFHDGRWRMNVDGDWYGSFPSPGAAEMVAVQLAQSVPTLSSRVVVRGKDGHEKVVWDTPQLVADLCQCLRRNDYGPYHGPADIGALRDEIAQRVVECTEYALSEDDVIDVVLASYGVRRKLSLH